MKYHLQLYFSAIKNIFKNIKKQKFYWLVVHVKRHMRKRATTEDHLWIQKKLRTCKLPAIPLLKISFSTKI